MSYDIGFRRGKGWNCADVLAEVGRWRAVRVMEERFAGRGTLRWMPETDTQDAVKLSTRVAALAGVEQRQADRFRRLGVHYVIDLLRHLPARYQFESAQAPIAGLQVDSIGTASGMVTDARWVPAGRGRGRRGIRGRFEAMLQDDSGTLMLTWFNGSHLRGKLHPGSTIRVQGKVKRYEQHLQIVNPRWTPVEEGDHGEGTADRLRPVYPATEELPSEVIERLIAGVLPKVLPEIEDPLSDAFRRERELPALADAYRMIHEPGEEDEWKASRRRLAYNELLVLELGIAIKRHLSRTRMVAPALKHNAAIDEHIRARFPFELTQDQSHVVGQIAGDLQASKPMNRLVQGDVGSGKTAVALYALLTAVANGKQGALMAPTELLAEQHYLSISQMLSGANVKIALLTGSQGAASPERAALLKRVVAGEVDIVIGTQALLTEAVQFDELAVVVVDEQHRFGVLQRAKFRQRSGGEDAEGRTRCPHYLVMTATPIPRTLSLTVFGDLDVSIIRGLPPGRTPITTRVVSEARADDVYKYVAERVAEGDQAYVVVPTIDAAGDETAKQLKSVNEHATRLKEGVLSGAKVATLHGRLKQQTRESIMARFRDARVDVLVATTVIEVGVDVPNATLMIVEHAERFGLAQLHQLRGRIGRGTHGRKSVCVFIAEPTTEDGQARLDALAETNDGFVIAERDLEIRGMGEFFGTRQSGLPPLRVATIPGDMDLLLMAKRDAEVIVTDDPMLDQPSHRVLKRIVNQQYGETLGLIDVG